jgi:hypothetical protein
MWRAEGLQLQSPIFALIELSSLLASISQNGRRNACRYSELLREIRLGNVKTVAFFDNDEHLDDRSQFQPVEGPCLVIFKDDRVAHSYVPVYDYRIP